MAYTTAAAFKTFRDIDGADDDTLIGTLITAVQKAIDNYTGRTFEGSAANRSFDAVLDTEGATLWVYESGDLASISSMTNGDGTSVTSGQYVTIPRNAVANGVPIRGLKLKASAGVNWEFDTNDDPEDAITVNGVWAYSATAPADIVQAANLWAGHLYDERLATNGSLVIVPGTSININQGIPPSVKAILDLYRLVR